MDIEDLERMKEYLSSETLEWIESARLFERYPQIDWLCEFVEDAARVRADGLWGFIGRDCEWIAEPQFEYVRDFSEGVALVQLPGDDAPHKYIDKSGEIVLDLSKATGNPLDMLSDAVESFDFHEGVARAYDRCDRMGFIDKSGRWVIEPQRWTCCDFHNGAAMVLKEGKEKYINHEGEFVKKPKNT